jgi:mannose-6-phosphate isomerase
LEELLTTPLPDGPIGEAWILSDRDDFASLIDNGPLKGQTIGQLLQQWPEQLMGKPSGYYSRFPLLMKFLDARDMLSVQVHPSDKQKKFLPAGEHGKTEAWVVLEAGKESRIYAGLKPGTTADNLQQALINGNVADYLEYFTPKPGDSVFIPAGTIHALGGDIVVFEVQQNSDVTFRLYDWNHVDAKTGQPRELQVEQAIACINFEQTVSGKVFPLVEDVKPMLRELLIRCEYFKLWRISGELPFKVGAVGQPRVLVCIAGEGNLEHEDENYSMSKGDVFLLPAIIGECLCRPHGVIDLLEISLPEKAS